MAETQGGAVSFNPDEASGLIDKVRATITKVVVDIFKSDKSDFSGVNANITFRTPDKQEFTERYLIGSAEEWAPNPSKTGVKSLTGKKIWNKSDIFKFVTSIVNAGFPKAQVGEDLSVFVGTDVHVERVAQEGATYKDKEGKDRQRTTMLVTKIYELPKAGGAKAAGGAKGAKGAAASAPAAPAGAGADDASNDEVLTEILVEILGENAAGVQKAQLPQPIFIKATKRKLAAQRVALQERAQNDAFLAGLAEQGLIEFDGTTVKLAA